MTISSSKPNPVPISDESLSLPDGPYVLLDDQVDHSVRFYSEPLDIITAFTPDDVEAAFVALHVAHQAGHYLAGYCAYELGYALEPKLAPLMPEARVTPLLCFGVFEKPASDMPLAMRYRSDPLEPLTFVPTWSEADYAKRFQTVIDFIEAGDVYQINLTFPLIANGYTGSAADLYAAIRQRQPGRYGGIVSLGAGHSGHPDIVSFSPELFFSKTGDVMTMRPMKGTRPRAMDRADDTAQREAMRYDLKSQAENLMIVDLLRNDLSRLSEPGSVKVPELFSLETYPTLHQMTSQIHATLKPDTGFYDIFKSLFPCGSVTGAPKIRAMEIIHALETGPRGAYCGAMGYIDPDGKAGFNVGIRTMTCADQQITYPVGSGVVRDSDKRSEYQECLLKADILKTPPTALIETFLWDTDLSNAETVRLDRHLARLDRSAKALGFKLSILDIEKAVFSGGAGLEDPHRMRLSLMPAGDFDITAEPLISLDVPVKIALSRYPLSRAVQETSHKISRRDFYDGERRRVAYLSGAKEVIFCNTQGALCEGSFTSLFIQKDGQLYTPALSCGLLPGILRSDMMASGKAYEAILTVQDILEAEAIYVGNSLRGLMPATLIRTDRV